MNAEKILEISDREIKAKRQEWREYRPSSEMAHVICNQMSGMKILAEAIIEELEDPK